MRAELGVARGGEPRRGTAVFPRRRRLSALVPAAVESARRPRRVGDRVYAVSARVSHGTLQASFEFQSVVAALTGMEVAKPACRRRDRDRRGGADVAALATGAHDHPARARAAHPHYRRRHHLPCGGLGDLDVVECRSAPTPHRAANPRSARARGLSRPRRYPNVLGVIEDLTAAAAAAHSADCLLVRRDRRVAGAGATLARPGACGADIVAAESAEPRPAARVRRPGLGLFASRQTFLRNLPGPRRRRDRRRRRTARLRPHARDARGAHSPRARDLEHICNQPRLVRLAGDDLRRAARSPRLARALAQRNVARGARAPRPVSKEAHGCGSPDRTSTSSWSRCRTRARAGSGRSMPWVVAGLPLGDWYPGSRTRALCRHRKVPRRAAVDRLVGASAVANGRGGMSEQRTPTHGAARRPRAHCRRIEPGGARERGPARRFVARALIFERGAPGRSATVTGAGHGRASPTPSRPRFCATTISPSAGGERLEVVRHFTRSRNEPERRDDALSAGLVHHEVQPADERGGRAPRGLRRAPPAGARQLAQGALELMARLAISCARWRDFRRHAAAGGGRARRAHRLEDVSVRTISIAATPAGGC